MYNESIYLQDIFIQTILMLSLLILIDFYIIIKFRIKRNLKRLLIIFNLFHVLFYFFISPNLYYFSNDSIYYFNHINTDLDFLSFVKYEFSNIISISLPAIAPHIFNYIISFIFDTKNLYVIGFSHIVLFHTSLLMLSNILYKKKLTSALILLLFLSPSVFLMSQPLMKDLFTLIMVIFSANFFIKKKYILFIIFVILTFLTRIYAILAIFPTVASILYLENYINNKSNINILKLIILHLLLSITLLYIVRPSTGLLDIGQSINIYLATLFAPLLTLDNLLSYKFIAIQNIESLITLIVVIFSILITLLFVLNKHKLSIRIPKFFILFVLFSFSYYAILIGEAQIAIHYLTNTNGLSVGVEITRKKLPILVIYYIFVYLIFLEILKLNKRIRWK